MKDMSKMFSSEQIDHILFKAEKEGMDWKKRAAVKPLLRGTVYDEHLEKQLQKLEDKNTINAHDRHVIMDLAFPSEGERAAA